MSDFCRMCGYVDVECVCTPNIRKGVNVEQPMNKIHLQLERAELECAESQRAFAKRVAEANIAVLRAIIELCCPHASPELMKDFRDRMDRYEADVRKKLEQS